jgi:hypothetical protein
MPSKYLPISNAPQSRGKDRLQLVQDANPINVEKEEKCDMEMCRAFCSKHVFDTCKEVG